MNPVTVGNCELYLGDCLKVMKTIPDASVDAVVTSPPYDKLRTYGGHSWDFEGVAGQLWRVVKSGGVVVWIVGDSVVDGSETGTSFRQALRFMELGFNLHDTMIYEKTGIPFPMHTRYNQSFEYMFVLSHGKPATFNPIKEPTKYKRNTPAKTRTKDGKLEPTKYAVGKETRSRTNIWRYCTGFMRSTQDKIAFEHPAIFPDLLAQDHIKSWSNKGDTILDPFMGSGTTLVAASKLGRKAIGIEINPQYFEIACKRVQESQMQPALDMA